MDGAAQIVTPAFVSLLCICIVFVPMFALKGVAGFLFLPMAESVVYAMIASFILSRTLVPTMAMYLLKPHANHAASLAEQDRELHEPPPRSKNPLPASSAASRSGSSGCARTTATCWPWRWSTGACS
ncbi:MAG: efflux RND transporter permease subunit [Caulobacteraceae bacterium]